MSSCIKDLVVNLKWDINIVKKNSGRKPPFNNPAYKKETKIILDQMNNLASRILSNPADKETIYKILLNHLIPEKKDRHLYAKKILELNPTPKHYSQYFDSIRSENAQEFGTKEEYTALLNDYFNAIKKEISDELSKKQPDFKKIDDIEFFTGNTKTELRPIGNNFYRKFIELKEGLADQKNQLDLKDYIPKTEKADFIKLGEALETNKELQKRIQELQNQLANSKEALKFHSEKYDEAKRTIEKNLKESKRVEDSYQQEIISKRKELPETQKTVDEQNELSETQKTVDEQNNKFKKIKELPLVRKKIKDIIDR